MRHHVVDLSMRKNAAAPHASYRHILIELENNTAGTATHPRQLSASVFVSEHNSSLGLDLRTARGIWSTDLSDLVEVCKVKRSKRCGSGCYPIQ